MGYVPLDYSFLEIAGPDGGAKSCRRGGPALSIPIQSFEHPQWDTSTSPAYSSFEFHDKDLSSQEDFTKSEAHLFQSIVTIQALHHEEALSAVEVLHLGTYFSTQSVDWCHLLVHFTSAHTLIIDYEQPAVSHEDGLVAGATRAAEAGQLLLPNLETILIDRPVPWRAREVSAMRAFVQARAACGASPISVRPLNENDWKPAVLKYFDGMV